MKRLLYITICALIALTACQGEMMNPMNEESNQKTEFAIVANLDTFEIDSEMNSADLDSDVTTKAVANAVVRLNWAVGDKLSAINITTGKALGGDLIAQKSGPFSLFRGSLTGSISHGDKIAFLYPSQGYTEEQDFISATIDLSLQEGTSDIPLAVYSVMDYDDMCTEYLSLEFEYLMSYYQLNLDYLPASTDLVDILFYGMGAKSTLSIDEGGCRLISTPEDAVIKVASSGLTTNPKGVKVVYTAGFSSPSQNSREVRVKTANQSYRTTWTSSALKVGKFYTSVINHFQEFEEVDDKSIDEIERSALMALYDSLDGDNWNVNENWGSDKPLSEWYGVMTADIGDSVTPQEVVYAINLSNNNLSGTITPEIGNLEHLEWINMGYNSISSPLPEIIGSMKLSEINLSGNPLNCEFPSCLINSSRTILSLDDCGIVGSLPESISRMPSLRNLSLINNKCTGAIPAGLTDLSNLEFLTLSGNAFSSFPPNIEKLSSLRSFSMAGNTTSISFDNSIWEVPFLEYLNLESSNVYGEIDSRIGKANHLTHLYVGNNLISGSIPNEIGNASRLCVLCLNNNSLSGTIPESIVGLEDLTVLDLMANQLEGFIPSGIGNLRKLEQLVINNNRLTGSLPDSFMNLEHLSLFHAFNNDMSGPISEDVALMDLYTNWALTPQKSNDNPFTVFFNHYSTDYSKHKQIKTLQSASIGKGIDIILMGEAFTDVEINSGKYDRVMEMTCEGIFELEPFKSHRDYFNIYQITLVSRNRSIIGETALGIEYEPYVREYLKLMGVKDFVQELMPQIDLEQTTIGIIINNHNGRPQCAAFNGSSITPYGGGISVSLLPSSLYEGEDGNVNHFNMVLQHELCGHGFGKLADEYVYNLGYSLDSGMKQYYLLCQDSWGWYKNISTTSNLEDVSWKKFIDLADYEQEEIGLYEGAAECDYGLWKATEHSIMESDYRYGFNAPSREAIYRRIHLAAFGPEWDYDFNEFLDWDRNHPGSFLISDDL